MKQLSNGLTLAVASDDGKHFIKRHFGDAESYLVYNLDKKGWTFVKKIVNSSEEERSHADPVKAGSIAGILKQEGVQVLVSPVFGPNIKRMIKKFACILMNEKTIEQGLDNLVSRYSAILEKWETGSERTALKL